MREVKDDTQSEAASNNQFISGAGVVAQAAARVLHGAAGAFSSAGLRPLHMTFVVGEVREGQAQLI